VTALVDATAPREQVATRIGVPICIKHSDAHVTCGARRHAGAAHPAAASQNVRYRGGKSACWHRALWWRPASETMRNETFGVLFVALDELPRMIAFGMQVRIVAAQREELLRHVEGKAGTIAALVNHQGIEILLALPDSPP